MLLKLKILQVTVLHGSAALVVLVQMRVSVRFHVILALKRFPTYITFVGFTVAMRENMFIKIFHLVKLGSAEIASMSLEKLFMVLFM